MPPKTNSQSSYFERLGKLIPAEVIAAYLAIVGIVGDKPETSVILFLSAAVLFIALPFFLYKMHGLRSPVQHAASMISFVVWVIVISGADFFKDNYESYYGSALMILWTTLAPLFPIRLLQPTDT